MSEAPQPAVDAAHIRANLDDVAARAAAAARAAGREPGDVRILLATKTQPAEAIRVAIDHGFPLIGENRVQELTCKAEALADLPHEAHLIGPLQKNKVNHALREASCIQSVDSAELAEKIQRRLEAVDGRVDVLVQVNTSREASKSGVAPEGAQGLLAALAPLDRLRVRGLMTIGLPGSTEAEIRPSYARLRELRDALIADGALAADACELSMGMSGDFELAIAEGATMVRVGSTVFGARPAPR
ncbi:YggS family pyridoxal phosphate-dependent enzyme [Brevibacterium sp. BRM-1]|uniref:YggS family pyridoxal phosphate-dependent enzyme n=1 Tax=Brevibacterium sp. BRM-1 TaxID=2999062 RepID=UPI002281001A|nr:YggS family pyridoxal phosphate-dependent enzyme [Brevibacterium sp. BRM-1]WAL39428.1 YggS family pyridoxal phosphate-dependent enzyme [Brevibacterium sp. BRM-1]